MQGGEAGSFSSRAASPKKHTAALTRESDTVSPKEQSGISLKVHTPSNHKPLTKKSKHVSYNGDEVLEGEKMAQSGMRMVSGKESVGEGEPKNKLKDTKEPEGAVIVLGKEDIQGPEKGNAKGRGRECVDGERKEYARVEELEERIKELEYQSLEMERKCEVEKMTRIKALRSCYQDKMNWRREKTVLLELHKKLGRMIEQIYSKIKQ